MSNVTDINAKAFVTAGVTGCVFGIGITLAAAASALTVPVACGVAFGCAGLGLVAMFAGDADWCAALAVLLFSVFLGFGAATLVSIAFTAPGVLVVFAGCAALFGGTYALSR